MITGKFVSCYSCAGEGSDQNLGSVRGGRRGGGRDMLVSKLTIVCRSKQSQYQNWKREFYIL